MGEPEPFRSHLVVAMEYAYKINVLLEHCTTTKSLIFSLQGNKKKCCQVFKNW